MATVRRSGLALILVVGVLGILAVLGSTFSVLSRLERRAAAQRVQATRAFLLARSGIEDAQARLDALQDPAYGGEDYNNDRVLNAGPETDGQVFQPAILNRDDCPAAQALRPSFFKAVGLNPRLVPVDARMRGYSGGLAGGTWSLKVTRPGGFFVNGGDPSVPVTATTDYNVILRRMLGTLAEALDRETGGNDGSPVDQADGWNLIDARPRTARGWESLEQIRDLALGGSQAKLDALRPYLTLSARTDKKVVVDNAPFAGGGAATWGHLKFLRKQTGSTRAPDLERINGRVVGRMSVDLSWARTKRPALLALMANLRGVYQDEYKATSTRIADSTLVQLSLDWSQPTDDCRAAADALLTSASELRTWEAWDAFCDALPMTGTSDQPQAKRDLLKTNFNPNARLNTFNPDRSQARLVDKAELLLYSTEFNLVDRGDARIACAGRVLNGSGRTLACRTLGAETRPANLFRLTAQSEFVAGDLGDPDVAGDESVWRAYGDFSYVTPSAGTTRTFGHTMPGCPGSGLSLQTWPEPHPVWTAPATGTPATYDGRVQLATVESEIDDGGAAGSMLFLARWDRNYDAAYSKAGGGTSNQPVLPNPGGIPPKDYPSATAPLWNALKPGQLYPDGVYSERGRSPGYPIDRNFSGSQGVISFWFKPNYDGTKTCYGAPHPNKRDHQFLNNTRTHGNSNPTRTSAFSIGHVSGANYASLNTSPGPYFLLDTDFETNDEAQDESIAVSGTGRVLPAHRWQLLSVLYDTQCAFMSLGGLRWLMDRGNLLRDQNGTDPKYGNGNVGTASSFSFSALNAGNPLRPTGIPNFYLGVGGNNLTFPVIPPMQHNSCDVTFDEFAIYDLGTVAAGASAALELLARDRFEAGRFYKESAYPSAGGLREYPGSSRNAGEWFSAPVTLGDIRIRSISWTQIVPGGLKRLSPVPAGTPLEDYDEGPEGRVVLEMANASVGYPYTAGAAYAQDVLGKEIDALFVDPRGEVLGHRLRGPFRLHAVFQPNLDEATKQNRAILDPLSLDDVTVAYRPTDQPVLSFWKEGE